MHLQRQRSLLSDDETCKHCGTKAREIHPAGVVPGAWTCTRCGRRQDESTEPTTQLEEN